MKPLNMEYVDLYQEYVHQIVRGIDPTEAIVITEFKRGKKCTEDQVEQLYFIAERLGESIQADLKYASDLYKHVSNDIDLVKWTLYRDFFLTKKYQNYLKQYLAVSTF